MKKILFKTLIMALAVMLVLPVFSVFVFASKDVEGVIYYSAAFEYDEGVEAILTEDGKPIDQFEWIKKFPDDDKLYIPWLYKEDQWPGKEDQWRGPYIDFVIKLKDGYELINVHSVVDGLNTKLEYCIDIPLHCRMWGDTTFFIETRKIADRPQPVQEPLTETELANIFTAIVGADKYGLAYLSNYKWAEPYLDRSFRHGEKAGSFLAVAAFEYLGFNEYDNLFSGEDKYGTKIHHVPVSYLTQKLDETFEMYDLSELDKIDVYGLMEKEKPGSTQNIYAIYPNNHDGNVHFLCTFYAGRIGEWNNGAQSAIGIDNYDIYTDESGKAAKIAIQGIHRDYNVNNYSTNHLLPEECKIDSVLELVLVYDTESGKWKIDEYYPLDFELKDDKPIYQSEVTGTPYVPEPLFKDEDEDVAAVYPTDETGYYDGAVFDAELQAEGTIFDAAKNSVGAEYEEIIPYSFTLKDASGKSLPLKSKVTVSVPVPEGWSAKDTLVFSVGEDGKAQEVTAAASEDEKYIMFETTHFSVWVLANASTKIETPTTDDSKDTGSPGTAAPDTAASDPGSSKPPKASTAMTVVICLVVIILIAVCGTAAYLFIKRKRSVK